MIGSATLSRLLVIGLSLLCLLVLWALVARNADPRVLPGPDAVWQVFMRDVRSGDMALHMGVTLRRVFLSFVLAMVIGSVLGIGLGMLPRLDRFFDAWVVVLLNIPALVVIVLAYVWFGLNETAAVCAVALNKIPNVIVVLREGAKALDKSLAEMGQVFRIGPVRMLRDVILPQLYPYVAVSARSGLALIWKIVLVVELLGRPNGVGFQIHLYFQLFDVAAILAYTLAFVAVMLAVEWLLLQPLEGRANRWRVADA